MRIAKEELHLDDKSVVVNFALAFSLKDIIGLEFKLVAHEIEVQAQGGPAQVLGIV